MSSMGIEGGIEGGIEALTGFSPATFPTVSATDAAGATTATGTTGTSGTSGTTGSDFGDLLVDSIDKLEAMGDRAADLSVRAATGDLSNIHDYTIAATEAQVATQLTVAVRDKAVDAFNEIMRMSV